jgi:hypothetical protein
MDINDDVMNLARGWVVQYEDGTIITEYDLEGNERNWKKIPKNNIKSLSLKWGSKHWTIYGKEFYIQYKRGWVTPVPGRNLVPNVEYRCIGYWEGNNKVIYKVHEATGKMEMIVESIDKKSDQ